MILTPPLPAAATETGTDVKSSLTSTQQLALTNIGLIHQLLIDDAAKGADSAFWNPQARLERIGHYAASVALGSGSLYFIQVLPDWPRVFLALTMLVATVWALSSYAISIHRDWRNRRIDTMQELSGTAQQEGALIRQLLPYSRAALLHVAAGARARDGLIGQRVGLILGANRAGGLLGGLLLTLGIFSAGKYLQDNDATLPVLGITVTTNLIVGVAAILFLLVVVLLIATARVSRLGPTAELLERVAALQRNLADEVGRP